MKRAMCLLGVLFLAFQTMGNSVAIGQNDKLTAEQNTERQNTDKPKNSKQKTDARAAEAKQQKPEPFRWVNPLQGSGHPMGLSHHTFKSEKNGCEVGYCIYLPAQYSQEKAGRFPVVYWLHGGRPGGELKSVKMATYVDKAMRGNEVEPMIYVFPNGGKMSHYDYPKFESYGETAFTELVQHIDRTYMTIPNRTGRAVEGFSQGGRATGRYMFKFPEMFCSAAPMGGGHQHEKRISEAGGFESASVKFETHNNTWDLARVFAKCDKPRMPILVVVGSKGFNLDANKEWSAHLKSLDIKHELVIVDDVPHSARLVYDKIGLRIMKFHEQNFKAAR
ncbi:MAG: enterochelin esterase-like enzyme [Pirellulaceae bacterium]|jgi:enterochelin esterase-like enzyme